jgi:hypothetical protein
MPLVEGCRRAGCGKTARPVRGGKGWKPEQGRDTEALSKETESNELSCPKLQAPLLDPTS